MTQTDGPPTAVAAAVPAGDPALEKSTLVVATFTSFMGPFMISAVNVALPAIQGEFAVSAVMLSWIATAYLLTTAVVLVPAGKIADLYGRKRVFLWGLIVLTAASAAGAAAPTVTFLILARVLQGFGAALVVTTGMAILTSVFPPSRRGRAIGIYVAAVYIGLAVGPSVGGVLTAQLGWRSIFATLAPMGLVAIAITVRYLKGEWTGARDERFDLTGSILYAVSLVTFICGATLLPQRTGVYLTVGGLAGLAAFVRYERTAPFPVFDVGLFVNNRLFAFSSLAALINYAATFAVTFMLSLYLQFIKGFGPQGAGLLLIFQPIVQAVFSPVAGRWSDRIEPSKLATSGMALTAAGLLQLVFIDGTTPTPYVVAVLVLLGFGFALFSSPNMNAIMGAVEKRYYGIASGVVATMRLLGQMVSMATATVVFALMLGSGAITPDNYPRFLDSLQIVFVIFTALCVCGIFFSGTRGAVRPR